jgi:NADP-dependent 3-hydroxy acid dehydrogenase YdfG
MSKSPILAGKHAVVFGAGGSIGAAVAREFASEGAEVFLAGRNKSNVEEIANGIAAGGRKGHLAVIDTLDDTAVNEYLGGIVKQTGKIDILVDAAGPLAREYGNGKIAVDLSVEEFMSST